MKGTGTLTPNDGAELFDAFASASPVKRSTLSVALGPSFDELKVHCRPNDPTSLRAAQLRQTFKKRPLESFSILLVSGALAGSSLSDILIFSDIGGGGGCGGLIQRTRCDRDSPSFTLLPLLTV